MKQVCDFTIVKCPIFQRAQLIIVYIVIIIPVPEFHQWLAANSALALPNQQLFYSTVVRVSPLKAEPLATGGPAGVSI